MRRGCSLDLHLRVQWGLALSWCLLSGVTGCQQPGAGEGLVVDFDLREFIYLDPEDARAHKAGTQQRSALRLVSSERLYLTAPRLRVEATSETMNAEAGAESQRVRSVTEYDWEGGFVWSANAGEPATRVRMEELDYESDNRYRRNRLDFVTEYVESPAVRGMADIDHFLGDGAVEDLGLTTFAGRRARVRRIAAEPGAVWEAWVLPLEESPFESIEEVSEYLVGAMAAPPSRALRLARRLGGVPVKITVTLLAGAGSRVLIEGFMRDIAREPDLPVRSIAGVVDEELERRMNDPKFLLDAVRHPDQLSMGLTPLAVFLKLSERMTEEHIETALELFSDLNNAYEQVELARSLLRCPRIAAWRRLREILFGERGELALHLVEALIAEVDARALDALMHVLRRAPEFADVDPDVVVAWGLSHLRILSGMSLAELVEYSTDGAIPDGALERSSAARSAELDRWFRWWEKKQASVPRF